MNRAFCRMWAMRLVAQRNDSEPRELCERDERTQGLTYLGTNGGDHIIRDYDKRVFRVDLVTRKVALCVGIAPRVKRW